MSSHHGRFAVRESVVHAQLGDEAVLLNVESGVYFGLDEVGARIWEMLSNGADQEDMVARLLDEYDADQTTLRNDVADFLDALAAKGLTAASDR